MTLGCYTKACGAFVGDSAACRLHPSYLSPGSRAGCETVGQTICADGPPVQFLRKGRSNMEPHRALLWVLCAPLIGGWYYGNSPKTPPAWLSDAAFRACRKKRQRTVAHSQQRDWEEPKVYIYLSPTFVIPAQSHNLPHASLKGLLPVTKHCKCRLVLCCHSQVSGDVHTQSIVLKLKCWI